MIQLAIAFIIFIAGAAAGVKWQIGIHASKELERIAAQERETLRRTDKIDTAAEKHEVAKAKIVERFHTIREEVDRVVEKPVYRNTCFDEPGMRAVADAIAAIAKAASEPAPAVSRPAPSRRWFGGGSAALVD